jgi:long-chain acyl-CoA synthetase
MTRTQEDILAGLPRRIIEGPRRWARETPDAPAVWCAGRQWTHGELLQGIDAAASRLRAAGVRPGDRVGLVIENGMAGLCFFYAITALDAWAVLANARLTARELDVIATDSGARLCVFSTGDSEAAAAHADAAGAARHGDPLYGEVALGPLNEAAEPEPVFEDAARQIAAMIFTSGSTGRPKGAMLSHRAILYMAEIVAERRRFAPGDCPFLVAPLVHILGLGGIAVPALQAGAALRIVSRLDVPALIDALAEGAVTHLYGPPPIFAALLGHARQHSGGKIAAPRIREILAGGAPVDETLRAAATEAFGIRLSAGYAATEFTPIACSVPWAPANPGAAGLPWHGIDFKLVNADGNAVAQGDVGEVWCRGPCGMSGYYRAAEATAEVMKPGGWIAIGDLGFLDEDGQIHLVGRLKDIILRSGFTVYPAEVEGVLNAHPDVALSAVVGRAVEGNEDIVAFVQPRADAAPAPAALAAWAAERLVAYKRPGRILLLDALPVGPTGKLDKVALRDRAAALAPAP